MVKWRSTRTRLVDAAGTAYVKKSESASESFSCAKHLLLSVSRDSSASSFRWNVIRTAELNRPRAAETTKSLSAKA